MRKALRLFPLVAAFVAMVAVDFALHAQVNAAPPSPVGIAGIDTAFRVTERIFSGSQPECETAFAALAELGVKTIISVDGAQPDVDGARKHGLRYVHLPIAYDGVPARRVVELARAAAPEAGVVFVHCHHGRHRGPAAVGVICEAVAGWSPAQAEAWLRQAGTSEDYPGLYRAVRTFRAPAKEELAHVGPLPEVEKTPSLVDAMVSMERHLDALTHAKRTGDYLGAASDATLLWEQTRELARCEDSTKRHDDYRVRLTASEKAANVLRDRLHGGTSDSAALDDALARITQSCTDCHKAYRNGKE